MVTKLNSSSRNCCFINRNLRKNVTLLLYTNFPPCFSKVRKNSYKEFIFKKKCQNHTKFIKKKQAPYKVKIKVISQAEINTEYKKQHQRQAKNYIRSIDHCYDLLQESKQTNFDQGIFKSYQGDALNFLRTLKIRRFFFQNLIKVLTKCYVEDKYYG